MSYLDPISAKTEWNAQRARHLLNRAGFGVPGSAAERLHAMGAEKAVDLMVNYEKFPDNLVEPNFITEDFNPDNAPDEQKRQFMAMTEDERRELRQDYQKMQREQIEQLKTWWLQQMRATNRPLQEKMALLWHGHFATAADKVKQSAYNYDINKVFRKNATGNFKDLVFDVGKSPAMLIYLDNRNNKKGRPNENWSRELMELFTLGIGHYTEDDIKQAARAFSGYTLKGGEFQFVSKDHDFGEKTFLGRTGDFDGADVINIILAQDQCSRFISKKIWEYLVYEKPSEELVTELATVLRENEYEMKPLLSKIFLSKEFYGERAMAGQVKSPAQYMVSLMDQLNVEMPKRQMVTMAMRGLGQDLFYPPNVKGWEGNRAWINTNTILTRYNIPMYAVTGQRPDLPKYQPLDEMAPPGVMMDGGDSMNAPGEMMESSGVMEVNAQQQTKREEKRDEKMDNRREKFKQLMQDRKAPAKPAPQKMPQLKSSAPARKQAAKNRRGATGLKIDITPIVKSYIGKTATLAAAGMTMDFLGRSLDPAQQETLLQVLSPNAPDRILTQEIAQENGAAFLHLLLSTAEYQLC